MGILDDAIREHLELRRQHGAAEDELQRQEAEALGPARRDVAQQPEEAEPDGRRRRRRRRPSRPSRPTRLEETALFDWRRRSRGRRDGGARGADVAVDARRAGRRRAARNRPRKRAAGGPSRQVDWSRRSPRPAHRRSRARLPRGHRSRSASRRSSRTRISTRTRRSSRTSPRRGRGRARIRRRRRGPGRARGDARLPPGDAGARPALVRAEAAARLRLRLTPQTGRPTGSGSRPPRRPPA